MVNGSRFRRLPFWQTTVNDCQRFPSLPALPFEKYAKVEVLYPDGQKRITQLTTFGPDTLNPDKDTAFNARLKKHSEQAAKGWR